MYYWWPWTVSSSSNEKITVVIHVNKFNKQVCFSFGVVAILAVAFPLTSPTLKVQYMHYDMFKSHTCT